GDAFWLAAWWNGRPGPPPWLPAGLLAEGERLAAAAAAARQDPAALADLADLDRRSGPGSVLGGQIAAAVDLAGATTAEVLAVLAGESLLRHPFRLASGQLLRRLGSDWLLADRVAPSGISVRHALIETSELAPLDMALEAARHLAEVERRLGTATAPELVEDLYPRHVAPVAELLSRAEILASGGGLIDPGAVGEVHAAARRTLSSADDLLRRYADGGFPGCLPVWNVGREVVAPLLREHGRVAVLLVDALRADVAGRVVTQLTAALPGRRLERRWAVVPSPTRTAEAVAALSCGHPVPAGSVSAAAGGDGAAAALGAPFAHLGYETAVVLGADRDHRSSEVRELWTSGPPVSVAIATGLDERLHRTSVEVAALLDEAVATLERRVLPCLAALPGGVPLVVLADHGFRENPYWGHGPEGRYVHGGTSLEECVIPVVVAAPVS
ncbi:MAG: hypothetical protein ACRDYY_04190, partial [Acidimicrobiales bacterium]